jgi:light-regulated signal transduction histidine kinase (bacteriophytochrome)
MTHHAMSLAALWFVGLGGIFAGATRLNRTVRQRNEAQEEIITLNGTLLAQTKELEAANSDLQAFNYSVSHDLRKPLTVINSYCQIFEELCGNQLEDRCKGYLKEMYESTMHMNQLIDVLLNFSRTLSVEMRLEKVDLSALANSIAAWLQITEPGRQVAFHIAGDIAARCDAGLLRIVLDNLMGNAWKFSAGKEKADITVGVSDLEGRPVYYVQDDGLGFNMADAEKLFVPFQRLPGTGVEGYGIGLATVRRIIQRHGGRVWAEGEPGKGATFYFTLPDRP